MNPAGKTEAMITGYSESQGGLNTHDVGFIDGYLRTGSNTLAVFVRYSDGLVATISIDRIRALLADEEKEL